MRFPNVWVIETEVGTTIYCYSRKELRQKLAVVKAYSERVYGSYSHRKMTDVEQFRHEATCGPGTSPRFPIKRDWAKFLPWRRWAARRTSDG